jgi:hypothetical protein
MTSAILAFGVVICLPACMGLGLGRGDEQEPAPEIAAPGKVDLAEKRVFLGNVSLVNERSQFVLIKTPVNQRLQAGMPLESFRDGQLSGELLFSPEQSYGFMTADVSRGAPAVGDEVYLRYTEDFDTGLSPRMQHATEQYEREKNMGFFERRKYEREQKRQARKRKGRE